MKTIKFDNYIFEVVESVPVNNYKIWNIGKNMIDDYLPLVQTGGHDGFQVNTETMKAIYIKDAQTVLKAIGFGQNTVDTMQRYVKRYSNAKGSVTKWKVERMKKALEIMRNIKGIENLEN